MKAVAAVLLLSISATACSGSGGSSAGSAKAFCDELNTQRDSTGSSSDDLAQAFEKLAAVAPAEIKNDIVQIGDSVTKFDSLTSLGSSDPTRSAEIDSSFSSVTASVDAAITRVTDFVKNKCGIDLGASTFSSVGSSISN